MNQISKIKKLLIYIKIQYKSLIDKISYEINDKKIRKIYFTIIQTIDRFSIYLRNQCLLFLRCCISFWSITIKWYLSFVPFKWFIFSYLQWLVWWMFLSCCFRSHFNCFLFWFIFKLFFTPFFTIDHVFIWYLFGGDIVC